MKPADHRTALGQTRFLLAVRAVAWLAKADSMCPSSLIADSVHAHATFLRRLFAPLVRSGIVEVREGRVGGYALGRGPDQITLADIYHAIRCSGDQPCPEPAECGTREAPAPLDHALDEILRIGESRFIEALSQYTVADLLRMTSTAPSR